MPAKPSWITRDKDESHEDFFFRLTEARKANTVATGEYIEQPHMVKNPVPKQDARKDTVPPQPSPKTSSTSPSEDGVEF